MNINFTPSDIFVVTGGTSGIGKQITFSLLDSGASVVALARNAKSMSSKKNLHLLNCDVSKPSEVKSTFEKIENKIGPISGLINNAGICPSRNNLTNTSDDDWNQTIAVNLSGAFYCSKYAISSMQKQKKGGAIIMISSIAAINGLANRASYSASKAGLSGLMRSIAVDYAADKIRSCCICPGYIPTELTQPYIDKLSSSEYSELLGKHRIGRLGLPNDIASVVQFFLSDYASWMTGIEIPVDGGYSI